jgi:hypothetical protein
MTGESAACVAQAYFSLSRRRREPRPLAILALGILTGVIGAVVAAPSADAFGFAPVKLAPDCVARVNEAALTAMARTNPIGQTMVVGDPAVFDPRLLRVTVRVFGPRTEIYAVDVAIDHACRVLSASTRLETNDWPSR